MSDNLPLNWSDKINSPELEAFIKQYGDKYYMTAEQINQLRDAVNEMAVIQQSTFLGAAEPTFTPAGTGRAYWLAVKPGTYANHGNVVLGANEIAFIIRDAADAFTISKTALDLSAVVVPPSTVPGPPGPQGSSLKVPNFIDGAYLINSQVSSLGKIWYNNAATSIGEIPGTSSKWVELLSGYANEINTVLGLLIASKNIFDKNTMSQSGVLSGITGGLSATNNWISTTKIKVQSNNQYTLSGLSNIATNTARVVFYQENDTFISAIFGTGNTSNVTFTTPSNCTKVAFNLFNGVGVGLNPSTSQYTSTLMLELGAVATVYGLFGTKVLKSSLKDAVELNPNCFYSVNPTGYNGRTAIMVYTKRGNTNRYVGHLVAHELDTSETKFQDLYRLISADEYSFDGFNMSLISLNTIISGENESVYLIPNKLDFVGGTHGNEKKQLIELYVDGIKIDITVAKNLAACKFAYYIQKSTMHEPPTSAGVVAVGHPIDAIHYKKTVFTDKGYTTYNDMLWQRVVGLQLWYIGIVCVGRTMADFAFDEDFDSATFANTQSFLLDKIGKKEINYRNQTTNRGCKVVSSIVSDTISDAQCGVKVWDRSIDAKYYRYTPSYSTVIGKRDKSVTVVEYF
jgi:hypothetical protein